MAPRARSKALFTTAVVACLQSHCTSFAPASVNQRNKVSLPKLKTPTDHSTSVHQLAATSTSPDPSNVIDNSSEPYCQLRRSILTSSLVATFGISACFEGNVAIAADGKLGALLADIKEARGQLDDVPDLIKAEKWDAVRAILVKPPLSTMWTSGGQNKLLNNYADAIGNEIPDGDEIAALELREDVISHLRYLDMAVYNNVFNPIASEGQSGATKELVRSYYEDPTNEWKASTKAIDELIGLASP
mmetsp:Transcript_42117/g.71983  ORF Transcript_42117/g.71983 Transcript_42117/m.71983 type:complete len:246 (-) Transcript_42117:90-827(-)|eukprot:CAMPEP_0183729126 /NCGR_PEP_ID=MMETSP0737-20130205/29764_1 /TAXON_ID=385413 /ORGANISM="Thalassiosira miniscula, Strain CCMP1093" /LENGTH=245 /DNA_ID=CAMNT_0025961245 /DNA_START=26 /DNA_END=763 /DNA_ORIENTATION=+